MSLLHLVSHGRSTTAMPVIMRLALIVLSTVLYGLSFPPYGWPGLAWICLVPFLVALRGLGPRSAIFWGWVSGVGISYAVTDFLPPAISTYYEHSAISGFIFFLVLVSVMCCPYHMLFSVWYRQLDRRARIGQPLLVAAAWVAEEFARTSFPGNSWGVLGYTQVPFLPLAQVADITGVYGISFAIAAVNAALAELVMTGPGWDRRKAALGGLALSLGIAAMSFGYGALRLQATNAPPDANATSIAVVQGNLDLGSQWRPDLYGENLDTYLRLTATIDRNPAPELVVWPENAMTFFAETEPVYRAAIARVLAPIGAELLAGGPRQIHQHTPAYFNSALLISAQGEIRATYDKQALVPFTEYFPIRSLDSLNERFGSVRQFSSGTSAAPVATPAGRAGVVICNEALFPDIVRRRVAGGAEFLVNLANDSWLGNIRYSTRVLDIVTLRAIEQRRFLVRASTSGISAIIDPWGRITEQSAMFREGVIRGTIATRRDRSIYSRVGDLFAWLCIVSLGISLIRRRRERSGKLYS